MSFGPPPRAGQFGKRTVAFPNGAMVPAITHTANERPSVTPSALSAALAFAEQGYAVFPCVYGKKTPATRNGYLGASSDPALIREMFDGNDFNIGIATGKSGLVVLDADGVAGIASYDALKRNGDLPETFTVRTRSGGHHYYFSAPAGISIRCSASRLGDKLDVRAEGGYVIAPPSWVAEDHKGTAGDYEAINDLPVASLPYWLAEILTATPVTASSLAVEVSTGHAQSDFPMTLQNIAKIKATLDRRIAADGWSAEPQWFRTLVDVRSLRDHACWPDSVAWEIFDHWSQHVGGHYDQGKNRLRWDRADRAIANPRTYRSLLGGTVVDGPDGPPISGYGRANAAGMTATELASTEFDPLVWVIEDLLPEGCYLLSARPKVGKSWLALQMAVSVAFGQSMWGKRVDQGPAICLMLEDNKRRLKSRLENLKPNRQWATDDLHLFTEWPRMNEGGVERLEALMITVKPRLVVIDTLVKVRPLSGRNENAYQSDYKALEPLTLLANKYRCAVVVITHNRKGRSEDDPIEMVSGTLGQAGAVDGVLVIDGKRSEQTYRLTVTGRDIEQDGDYAIGRRRDGGWDLQGGAAQVFISNERKQVTDLMRVASGLKPKDIAERLGKKAPTVRKLLISMLADGQLEVDQHGGYALPK